jgi:hypothetical protein
MQPRERLSPVCPTDSVRSNIVFSSPAKRGQASEADILAFFGQDGHLFRALLKEGMVDSPSYDRQSVDDITFLILQAIALWSVTLAGPQASRASLPETSVWFSDEISVPFRPARRIAEAIFTYVDPLYHDWIELASMFDMMVERLSNVDGAKELRGIG